MAEKISENQALEERTEAFLVRLFGAFEPNIYPNRPAFDSGHANSKELVSEWVKRNPNLGIKDLEAFWVSNEFSTFAEEVLEIGDDEFETLLKPNFRNGNAKFEPVLRTVFGKKLFGETVQADTSYDTKSNECAVVLKDTKLKPLESNFVIDLMSRQYLGEELDTELDQLKNEYVVNSLLNDAHLKSYLDVLKLFTRQTNDEIKEAFVNCEFTADDNNWMIESNGVRLGFAVLDGRQKRYKKVNDEWIKVHVEVDVFDVLGGLCEGEKYKPVEALLLENDQDGSVLAYLSPKFGDFAGTYAYKKDDDGGVWTKSPDGSEQDDEIIVDENRLLMELIVGNQLISGGRMIGKDSADRFGAKGVRMESVEIEKDEHEISFNWCRKVFVDQEIISIAEMIRVAEETIIRNNHGELMKHLDAQGVAYETSVKMIMEAEKNQDLEGAGARLVSIKKGDEGVFEFGLKASLDNQTFEYVVRVDSKKTEGGVEYLKMGKVKTGILSQSRDVLEPVNVLESKILSVIFMGGGVLDEDGLEGIVKDVVLDSSDKSFTIAQRGLKVSCLGAYGNLSWQSGGSNLEFHDKQGEILDPEQLKLETIMTQKILSRFSNDLNLSWMPSKIDMNDFDRELLISLLRVYESVKPIVEKKKREKQDIEDIRSAFVNGFVETMKKSGIKKDQILTILNDVYPEDKE